MQEEKKPIDIEGSVTYESDQVRKGANVVDAEELMQPRMGVYSVKELKKDYKPDDYAQNASFGKSQLTQIYNASGNSAEAVYNGLVDYLKANKDDLDTIRLTVSSLSAFGETFYDDEHHRGGAGNSPAEILEAWINAEEGSQIKGNICGEIHGVMAHALRDAGIPATLVVGKGTEGESHIALIYKDSDGKYVFNDYGANIVLNETKSILGVIDEVQAGSDDFDIVGWYTLEDGGDVSFQKFAYEKENAYGETIDKTAYNRDFPQAPNIADNAKLSVDVTSSDKGNIKLSTEFTTVKKDENGKSQTVVGLEGRQTENSALFNGTAYSIGAEYKHDVALNNGLYHKTATTLSYLTGKVGGQGFHNALNENEIDARMCADINRDLIAAGFPEQATYAPELHPEQETWNSYSRVNNLTASVQHFTGKESNIANTENITVTNTAQAGVIAGVTTSTNHLSINGDARFIFEDGVKADLSFSPQLATTVGLSVGAMEDLKISHKGFPVGLQPAFCAKGVTGLSYNNGENFELGTSLSGYGYNTASTHDRGLAASLSATYKPSQDLLFKGSLFAQHETQQLNMNMFNERVTDKTTFGAFLEADMKNSTIGLGANIQKDKINPTKNNTSVMANWTVRF